MKKVLSVMTPLALSMMLLAGSGVYAAPVSIIVNNPSFETPTPTDGNYNTTVTDWAKVVNGGTAVTFNPSIAYYSSAAGNATPTGGDGINVLSVSATLAGRYAGVAQVITNAQLTAGQRYTLTVAVGDNANTVPIDWYLAISTESMAVGSYLALYSGTTNQLTNDALVDFSVSYTASGAETQIGENLKITIWGTYAGSGSNIAFDKVRLTAEPGSVANHSFEDNVLADGAVAPASKWAATLSGGSSAVAWNPTNGQFTASTGNGTPSGADRVNVLACYVAANNGWAGVYQNVPSMTLIKGHTYTLTAAVGAYATLTPGDFNLAISTSSMAVGNYLAKYVGTAAQLTNDQFNDFSIQYKATGLEAGIGEKLRVTIFASATSGTPKYVAFDNVRLTEVMPPKGTMVRVW